MSAHADMVLVDTTLNNMGDEVFVVRVCGVLDSAAHYEDVREACDRAAALAKRFGVKWDVTLHARNAADMW